LKIMAVGVPKVAVENLTVIDAHNGTNVTKMASFLEQLRQTTGFDIAKVASHLATGETISNQHIHPQNPKS
jgi:flotillin